MQYAKHIDRCMNCNICILTFIWVVSYRHKNCCLDAWKLILLNSLDTFTVHFKHPQWLRSSHSFTQTCGALYLLTNLNWSCFACPMRSPFSLNPPPFLFLFLLLLLFIGLQIVSTQSFVLCLPPSRFYIGWAELTLLTVYLQEIQSSHQTWPPSVAYPCSRHLQSHFFLSPLFVLFQLAFVLYSIKCKVLSAGTCGWCWVKTLIIKKAKKGH